MGKIQYLYLDSLEQGRVSKKVLDETRYFIKMINRIYIRIYNNANDERDKLIRAFQRSPEEKEQFLELKHNFYNDKITEFVENSNEVVRIVEVRGQLYQKIDPIYLDPDNRFIKAHFYAPRKKLFNNYYSTFWINIGVIWMMSIVLYIILYFRLLKRMLDFFEQSSTKWKNRE
ncbi:MAG: hypothetical protein HC906_09600 [Bacteroidales bacterium]|nr:hypothetical protein [Bacteroidales bacterium]